MIILSAGHYAEKVGASCGQYTEYPYTSIWVNKIQEYILSNEGMDSVVVASGTLPYKVSQINQIVANAKLPDPHFIAVELHFNSDSSGKAHGNETLYCPGSKKGKLLATTFNNYLMKVACPLLGKDRGVKEGWYRMDRPDVVDYKGDVDGDEKPDYFLKETKCPALILEPCFIQDLDKFIKYENEICKGISESLIEAYKVLKKLEK